MTNYQQQQSLRTLRITLPVGAKDELRQWCAANGYRYTSDLVRDLITERTGINLTPNRGGYRPRKLSC